MQLPFKSSQINVKPSENVEKPKRSAAISQDYLANERTYLAWMRTSIALMGFGMIILRLRATQPPDLPHGYCWYLGFIFSIIGLSLVLLSTQNYFFVRHQIEHNTYNPPNRRIIFFSLTVMLLGLGILYFIGLSATIPKELIVFE